MSNVKSINLDEIVKEQVLTALIQERDSQILALASKVNDLEKDNAQLKTRLAEFETKKDENPKK